MAVSRRGMLKSAAAVGVGSLLGSAALGAEAEKKPAANAKAATTQANEKPNFAVIGCGGITRFHAGNSLKKYANIVALADVDEDHLASYNKEFAGGKAFCSKDYRAVLDRPDVDMVLVGTPDHWHTKIAMDTLRAGKDLYCEKPLTLTIDEGRILCRTVRETNRVMQVGTQQRSDRMFLTAVALAHSGRLGKIHHVTVAIGDTPAGANFEKQPPPPGLDWDLWLGQAPKVPYMKQRCHFDFRWWYEYSGGRMTDWGAHHVDIAQWAVAPDLPGPMWIEPVESHLPVKYQRGWPTVNNGFNTADRFNIKFTFANGVEMFVKDRTDDFPEDNGILIEGDGGWLFVDRGKVVGPAVDRLKDEPLPDGVIKKLMPGMANAHEQHVYNFIEAAKGRGPVTSDVFTHTRNLATCHLANIAMRLGRKIRWDATAQEIVGDSEADALQRRQQRRGFETV